MKAKLTATQRLRLQQSFENVGAVLREVKVKPLKGEALEVMQMLEDVHNSIGAVLIISNK